MNRFNLSLLSIILILGVVSVVPMQDAFAAAPTAGTTTIDIVQGFDGTFETLWDAGGGSTISAHNANADQVQVFDDSSLICTLGTGSLVTNDGALASQTETITITLDATDRLACMTTWDGTFSASATIEYPAGFIEDNTGSPIPNADNETGTDAGPDFETTAPTLSTWVVDFAAETLILTFDEPVTDPSTLSASDIIIHPDATTVTLDLVTQLHEVVTILKS
ncbi:MAG: hypothetical protein HRU07_04875 [Nitrosopumilus sp.]|nr:hypothetical protein [Nitrosopumilus sp.]NRA05486.1 hypothetical protein [Nitrosopumilus sp.]